MTEERDVLSAERVAEIAEYIPRELGLPLPGLLALARSHEALREKFDHLYSEWGYGHARGDHLVYESEWEAFDAWQRSDSAAAAAAIDALRQIAETMDVNSVNWFQRMGEMCDVARAAVDAYETAVRGHATPAAEEQR